MFHVTERLLLRPAWPEDADAIFGGIADEGLIRNLARAPWPYSRADAQAFAMRGQDPLLPNFLVTHPGSDGTRVVGSAGLGELEDGGVELGYWIARPYWNRGFATEAVRGVIEIARLLGHANLTAGHFADNPASGRVLRKAGFQPTGQIAKRHSCGRGEAVDCVMFALDLVERSELPVAA